MRTLCSNPQCPWASNYKGGRFVWRGADPYCEDCAQTRTVMNVGQDTQRWDFTTTNLHPEGKAVHVQSLRHLRQLEQQYGAVCSAANQNEKHWN